MRARPLAQPTVVLFWLYFKDAHKRQRAKDKQGNEEANSVMQQMANKIESLKHLTNNQRSTLNKVVNQVNESNSREDRSIPGMIKTTSNSDTSTELTTARALIVSLTTDLSRANNSTQRRQDEGRGQRHGGGGGRTR